MEIIKVSDFVYRFPVKGFKRPDGICRVRIFVNNKYEVYVILTDLGENNTSACVENAFVMIKNSLILKGYVPMGSMFIVHEEREGRILESFRIAEKNDLYNHTLSDLSKDFVLRLVDATEDEFSNFTMEFPYLEEQIRYLRQEINPYAGFPAIENYEVLRRQIQINDNKIEKKQIADLVDKNAKEQEISNLIKKDLSLIAERYAFPEDEYICFSEFKINDKKVDFVIFTERSRMNVILIEIKGADFSLSKKNHYENFNNKIGEAEQQLSYHDRYISHHYEEFRNYVHNIRKQVEEGKKMYNSLLCPKGHLHVDPDKDINIRKIIIAGRTGNDLEDSKKRTGYEKDHGIYFLETWDSWLSKLRRS